MAQSTGSNIEISSNGMVTCYDDLGSGQLPIIFIHGFPFDKSSWQPQMDFLKATHRVIAYDIRGFGKSTIGDEKLSITLFADDLIRFMDMLQISKAIVCGLSMGGYILLNAAYRYQERFEALILADTQCTADLPQGRLNRRKSMSDINTNGLKEFADNFMNTVFSKAFIETKNKWLEIIKTIILTSSVKTVTQTLNALAIRWETCSTLNEIMVPTLILCGSEDSVTPIVKAKFLHTEIKNSELQIIENAGHLSNLEQPEIFNTHLINFISKIKN